MGFVVFLVIMTCSYLAAESVGLLISATFVNVRKSIVVASVVMLSFLLSGGLYIEKDQIPDFMIWVRQVAFTTYAFDALQRNEYEGEAFECTGAVPENSRYTQCPIPGDEILDDFPTRLWAPTSLRCWRWSSR